VYKDPTGHGKDDPNPFNSTFLNGGDREKRVVDVNGASSKHVYYAKPTSELDPGYLQDIVVDSRNGQSSGVYRTIVKHAEKDGGGIDKSKINVYRFAYGGKNEDGTTNWVPGEMWSVDSNRKGENFKIRNQKDIYGQAYQDVGFATMRKKCMDPNGSDNPTVDIGYYRDGNDNETPDNPTPLRYIEVYDYVNGQWRGDRNRNNNWNFNSNAAIPNNHQGLTRDQILQEQIPTSPNRTQKGFHELMQYQSNGNYDLTDKPYKNP
jgi:hypothetical protein